MQAVVLQLLQHARDRFAAWLGRYEAWHGVNGITERNLSFQVATSFLAQFNDSVAFMEVPFSAAEGGRTDKHLDAYLFSPALALLVESKIVWAPRHVSWVAEDIDRMTPPLISQLRRRHIGTHPQATHGLVVAETWSADIANWWAGEDGARPRWQRGPLLTARPYGAWQFGFLPVHQARPGREGTLFWLYGVSPELTSSASGRAV